MSIKVVDHAGLRTHHARHARRRAAHGVRRGRKTQDIITIVVARVVDHARSSCAVVLMLLDGNCMSLFSSLLFCTLSYFYKQNKHPTKQGDPPSHLPAKQTVSTPLSSSANNISPGEQSHKHEEEKSGEVGGKEEKEEEALRELDNIVNAFRWYYHHVMHRMDRSCSSFSALPQHHRDLVPDFEASILCKRAAERVERE